MRCHSISANDHASFDGDVQDWSTMWQEHYIQGLALLNNENKLASKMNFNDIINDFANAKARTIFWIKYM